VWIARRSPQGFGDPTVKSLIGSSRTGAACGREISSSVITYAGVFLPHDHTKQTQISFIFSLFFALQSCAGLYVDAAVACCAYTMVSSTLKFRTYYEARKIATGCVVVSKKAQEDDEPSDASASNATTTGALHQVKHHNPLNDGHPRDVVCHICGRKYTIHSIHIHIPQCEQLFQAHQEQLPKSERKTLPQLPDGADKMSLKQRNATAVKIYNDCALEACRFCKRTFLPDRLKVHISSCARNHGQQWPPKTKTVYPTTERQETEANNTAYCHICGRKYTSHSIDIHLPQCEQLWKDRQDKQQSPARKPVPQMPDKDYKNLSLDKRNEMALQVYNDVSLEKCQYCARTFLSDRLEVHLRSCARHHHRQQQQHAKK
jgi:zinc-finger of a C2HC-type